MNDMYKRIEERTQKAKKNGERPIIMRYFNCKRGTKMKGNKEEITTAGKILVEIVNKNKYLIANGIEKCQEKWTRQCGENKSILDYIILKEEDESDIKEIRIDEERKYTPF